MSHALLIGKSFEGYTLTEIAATGTDEVLFVAERARDGEPVWIRTARSPGSDSGEPGTDSESVDSHTRFRQRYQAEQATARKLSSIGALLPVREIIDVDGAPALVTDRPRGRSLNDVFADGRSEPSLAEVLPWFRKLMQAMEAAHDEGAAHGSLSGRAVYLDDEQRITICGLAEMKGDVRGAARRADVRALAALLYTASCGRPPRRGFPDTGLPVSPEEYVEDYPASLARFLCRRLGDVDDDPVEDAGVFRRSIDALSVDPEFRRAAGLGGPSAPASDTLQERAAGRKWRRMAITMAGAGALVALTVLVTILIMEVRVEEARKQAAASVAPAPAKVVVERPNHPRLAAWDCLHQRFVAGELGPIASSSIEACLQLAPDLDRADLVAEMTVLATQLTGRSNSDDDARSLSDGYDRMFDQGADAVAQHLAYRLERRLSTEGIEAWVAAHPADKTVAILQTLSKREGPVADWSRRTLERTGGGK